MKKRFLSIFMAAAVAVTQLSGFLPLSFAYAEEESSDLVYGDFSYQINGNSITITKYNGSDSFVYIPDQIDGRDVTIIGREAFYENKMLENIRFPNKLDVIDDFAFFGCENLQSITLPNSLTAFYSENSSYHYSVGESYYVVKTFQNCGALGQIVMGKNLVDSFDTFYDCDSISEISLSESLSSCYLYDCAELSDVYFRGVDYNNCLFGDNVTIHMTSKDGYNRRIEYIEKYLDTNSDSIKALLENTVYTPLNESHARVTFDGNGGMIPDIEGNLHETDDIWTLLGQTVSEEIRPEKEGCDFLGWYDNPEGNGEPWDFVFDTVSSDMTLYAKFVPARYTVTFDAQGGDCTISEQQYSSGLAMDSLPVPTKLNYQFIGWYTRPNANGELYTSASAMPRTDLTLYAGWLQEGKSLVVNYDANGGECDKDKSLVAYNTAITDLPTPTREGEKFIGWNTKADGSGEYYDRTTKVINLNLTLYAIWEVNSYTLTFDADKGTVSESSRSVDYNTYLGKFPTPERSGYEFIGWFYEDGTEADSYDKMPDRNVKLKARWRGFEYVILFDARGGTVSDEMKSVSCGENVGKLPIPVRSGYEFIGWYTKPRGKGIEYTEKSEMPEKDITLYANWKKITEYASSIKFAQKSITLGTGEKYTLEFTTSPEYTIDKFKWTSSDEKVVSVSSKGVLTANGKGTATVKVTTSKGKTASIKVTVKTGATKLTLPYSSRKLSVGQTIKITVKADGYVGTLKWKSSAPSVVKVDENGNIQALKSGTATITVTAYNGVAAQIKITVK